MQSFLKRWHWWLLAASAAFTIYLLLPWFGKGPTEGNAHRIAVGMTRDEVESILGPPNDIQARLSLEKLAQEKPETERTQLVKAALEGRKTNGELWDGYSYGDWGRYISIMVFYDAEGRVDRKHVSTFWRYPWK